ncbi:MAG TPA: zinc ribbon domain-containing protein [Thermodesulfovibrionales bacterium]|nr:zinc ribbon domain-containing protein [Thermodesulfovibrionales bacterium]
MPVYEYECESCGTHHEIMQKYTDMPLAKCPACGGHVRKLVSNTSFVLKGSGWYKTDYASGSSGADVKAGKSNGKKNDKKSEPKPEQKTESSSKTQ